MTTKTIDNTAQERTIDSKTLSDILDRSRRLFQQSLEIEALNEAGLLAAAAKLHSQIQDLVNRADSSGVISQEFMEKSGIWIQRPRIITLQDEHGILAATMRHGREAAGRARDHKPNDIRGDFASAVHHVFRYANNIFQRGAPKHYGRIEESSGHSWQQAILE
jgi:hypothetical protein